MFYLFLATLCSASIALIFKHSEGKGNNRYAVTTTNYLVAFITSAFMIAWKGLLSEMRFSWKGFDEFSAVLSGAEPLFSPLASVYWGMVLGSIAGIFFFLSFIYYQKSVKENGAGISGTFAKLGILIPMIFSVVLWREMPTAMQWGGILLALTSILLVNVTKDALTVNKTLLLLFLLGGFAEFSNKIFQKYAINAYKDVFLLFVFFTAFLISWLYTVIKKSPVKKQDLLIGFCVGVPNLFSSYFLILSLDTLKTSVVFPVYSAGSIVLIGIGSRLWFKESFSQKEKISIALTLMALILINI